MGDSLNSNFVTSSEEREEVLKNYVENQESVPINQVGPKLTEVPKDVKKPWEKNLPLANQLGWIPLPITNLPTQGLFYHKGTVIVIRSASGGEIRHWSTLQEDDLSALDDMLNYVVERCVTIKTEGENAGAVLSWKDIKEVDRFYLLLAIQELTFPKGENKLQVKVSDTKKLDVRKEMVHYISFEPALMKYYDEDQRSFILKFKSGKKLELNVPSVGVTQWLKQYVIRKQRMQEYIDEDYLNFAPFVITQWRGLNDDSYLKYVEDSHNWDVMTVSLLVHVKQLFSDTINPVIKYTDEGGMEQSAPLNFQGGIKSLFLISDPFGQLV